jgi:ubiquinone/menaquinone biosynthesis C-methylase UbiE
MTQSALPSPHLPALDRLHHLVDRGRYLTQQTGLVTVLTAAFRGAMAAFGAARAPATLEDLRFIERRLRDLFERDLANVEQGIYPRDLLFQMPLGEYARRVPEVLLDMPRVMRRSRDKRHDDLPAGVDREAYPSYYLRTFHWQTDGWFSDRSARLYDANVELLFGGTADIMRRMSLPPLLAALGQRPAPRVLDVACGTGRLLVQLAKAHPTARLFGVDLSEPYLAKARRWLGDRATLVAENAEHLPFVDGYFDAVSSVFLFHELPRDARRAAVREAFRVLRPGGTFVVNDSAQLSESPELEIFLRTFPVNFHEPYYKGYIADPLEGLLAECGFEVTSCEPHFVSKVVVGRKPL